MHLYASVLVDHLCLHCCLCGFCFDVVLVLPIFVLVLTSFSLQRLFYVSLIQHCSVFYFDDFAVFYFDSALQCFLTLCKFFFLKLLLSRRRGFLPLCVNIIVVSAFNTCASSFWFWHGRCNCFASCRVSAPRFLAVSFFFVATFLFLHYLLSHLHPAQAKGLLVLLLMCHFFHQILPLNFLSWTVKRRYVSPVCKEISLIQ